MPPQRQIHHRQTDRTDGSFPPPQQEAAAKATAIVRSKSNKKKKDTTNLLEKERAPTLNRGTTRGANRLLRFMIVLFLRERRERDCFESNKHYYFQIK